MKKLIHSLGSLVLAAVQALLICAMIALPLSAGQNNLYNPTSGTLSGLSAVQNYNNALDSLNTQNSGGSAPTNQLSGSPSLGNSWLNTSSNPNAHEEYDGSSWLTPYWLDTVNHYTIVKVGGGTASVASATTTDLCNGVPQAYLTITGTTTIASFGSTCGAGHIRFLTFSGALTLTYNATSMILPGAASISTAAGDTAIAIALGSGNWKVVNYMPASALPVGPISSHTILANTTGGSAVPGQDTLTSIIDAMIGSTQGAILYRNSSSWVPLTPGTAGQLLQTGGASANPSWATVAAPVLLNTLTASNSANLQDTSSITATYDHYELVIEGLICATSSQGLTLLSHSNGSFQNSSYLTATTGSISTSPTGGIALTQPAESQIDGGFFGQARIYQPSLTAAPKTWVGSGGYTTSTGPSPRAVIFYGLWNGGNTAVDGFEVLCNSGNITSGSIRVYGLP